MDCDTCFGEFEIPIEYKNIETRGMVGQRSGLMSILVSNVKILGF